MNKGNVSKEYADQRIMDSPLHKLLKLQKSCTRSILEEPVKEESEDGNNTATD